MRKRTRSARSSDKNLSIYGQHAAAEALQNAARPILGVTATRNAANRLADQLAARGISPTLVDPGELDRLLGRDAVHQGVAVSVGPLPQVHLADLLARGGTLIVLDQVTDPRNVGAIVRLAAAFAVRGLIVTRRNRPSETGVLAKAASGGLEHVPICEVPNLARTLEQMRDAGFVVIGLDSDGDTALDHLEHDPRTAVVLGAEGTGLRRLTRVHCDHIARIDLPGPIRSVNVATATALALQTLHAAAKTAAAARNNAGD
ncbi:23S rRNA (guanosine(2251)-2'-O)-methyltransferase [hydrothermal vent metagenome]|uniref:23S rRNA (Guanosine(2251)-2'-O)-methyltransferase n=1 Tax=hydrothermal vent metagenome TaxID=652676 RepID=A0A3B0T7S6_9ZZZZ